MNSHNLAVFNSVKRIKHKHTISEAKYKCISCIGDHKKTALFNDNELLHHISASHSKDPSAKLLKKIVRYTSYAIELGIVYPWKLRSKNEEVEDYI